MPNTIRNGYGGNEGWKFPRPTRDSGHFAQDQGDDVMSVWCNDDGPFTGCKQHRAISGNSKLKAKVHRALGKERRNICEKTQKPPHWCPQNIGKTLTIVTLQALVFFYRSSEIEIALQALSSWDRGHSAQKRSLLCFPTQWFLSLVCWWILRNLCKTGGKPNKKQPTTIPSS